ncbi:hypothetical protein L195_g060478, partial [Trifolium pratense]
VGSDLVLVFWQGVLVFRWVWWISADSGVCCGLGVDGVAVAATDLSWSGGGGCDSSELRGVVVWCC